MTLQLIMDFTQTAFTPGIPASPAEAYARAQHIRTGAVLFITAEQVDEWRNADRNSGVPKEDKQHRQWRYCCTDCPDARYRHKKSSDVVSRTTHWALEEGDWHNNPKCLQYDAVIGYLKTGKFLPAAKGGNVVLSLDFLNNLNQLEHFLGQVRKSGTDLDKLVVKDGQREIPFTRIYMKDTQSLIEAGLKNRTEQAPRRRYILELEPDLSTFAPLDEDSDIGVIYSRPETVIYRDKEYPLVVKILLFSQEAQDLFHGGKIAPGDRIRVKIDINANSNVKTEYDAITQIRDFNTPNGKSPKPVVRLRTRIESIKDVVRTWRVYEQPAPHPATE